MELYPNPTNGEIFITFKNIDAKEVAVWLIDAVGKKIGIEVLDNSNQQKIVLPNESPKGMYFLNIQMDNKIVIKKIIKN